LCSYERPSPSSETVLAQQRNQPLGSLSSATTEIAKRRDRLWHTSRTRGIDPLRALHRPKWDYSVTTNPELATLLKAATFAANKHRMQRRKDVDASPYINHPLALANILCAEGGITDVRILVAALLHDTIEDTATTPEELDREFGGEIASIVREVTDDKDLSKEERKRLQVVKAGSKSVGAKLVKLADKISNLRDIAATPPADWTIERRTEYFTWARQVVEELRGTNAGLEAAFDASYAEGLRRIREAG
jgi:guanosine-3',5'-bis(diphosphate) 3'-pyrophosphohydrolase